ncbi:MAG: SxtJ family membrane protein [Patescibacteria group bacterium]
MDKKTLRRFGMTMGIAFLVISLLILAKSKHILWQTSIISALFFILGLIFPGSLKLVYVLWMRLAFILGWVNTRIILFVLFYLIFTPIGLVIKLTGKDLLERKIDKSRDSYWIKKEKKEFSALDYERQF